MQIGILEPLNFSKEAEKALRKRGKVSKYSGKDLKSFLKNKQILFIRLNHMINSKFINNCPKLKYLCSPTTGLNHIDLELLKKKRIKLISLTGETSFLNKIKATPEHTLGLVLSLLRNYKGAFLNKRNRIWNRDLYIGDEIHNNTVGIIGFGRVGQILAKYFKALGTTTYFYDKSIKKEKFDAKKVSSIKTLINKSNIVILSASFSKENINLMDKKCLDLLKDKYFINTSRGELVDEKYLTSKLKKNHFKGVALDVIENEQGDNRLKEILNCTEKNNLIITPHIGGITNTSLALTEGFIVKKLSQHIRKDSAK